MGQRNGALSNYEATRYGIKNYRNGRCTNCDENDELFDRWSFGGSTPSYSYGGTTYNSGGYNANPSSSAINNAQRNGALSNYEATRYGIKNYRNGRCTNCDENDELFDRWSFGGSTPSYSYGGTTYNSGGYNANPSSSAINNAQRNGAL